MTEIRRPTTDLASALTDAASAHTGSAAKTAAARKTAPDRGNAFRDVLGVMTRNGKAARAAPENASAVASTGSFSRRQPATSRDFAPAAGKRDSEADPASLPGANATPTMPGMAATDVSMQTLAAVLANVAPAPGCSPRMEQGASAPVSRQPGVGGLASAPPDRMTAAARPQPAASGKPALAADLRAALANAAGSGPPAVDAPLPGAIEAEPVTTDKPVEFRVAMPAKVTVLTQETHFAPVPAANVMNQVADAIVTDLPALLDQAQPAAAGAAVRVSAGADRSPVRILTVRLDPPELGEVTVNMRLKGDSVEVRMSAASHETARLLQAQRDTLSDLMRDSGYDPDVVNVQVVDVQASPTSGGDADFGRQFGRSDAQQQSVGDERRQGGAERGTDNRDSRPDRQQTMPERRDRAPADPASARSSAIYL
jgi:chemotaxis protein MotD